jgi:hypothetical protein
MTQGERRTPGARARPAASRKTIVRAGRLVLLVALALAQSGCYVIAGAGAAGAVVGGATGAIVAGKRPAQVTAVGAAVSVTLDPPRDLTLTGAADADTTYVRGASAVVGQVVAERGDTLFVALTEVQGARGPATFPAIAGPTAAVVRGPGVAVRVIARDADRRAKILLGAVIGATASILGLYLWCAQTRCLD